MAAGQGLGGHGCGERTDRRVFWRGHIDAQGKSGFSIRRYCRNHGLTEALFYQWRRRLTRETGASDVRAGGEDVVRPLFVPVRVKESGIVSLGDSGASAFEVVEVVLQNGRLLRVRPGFDGETLQRAVAALESPSC